MSAFRRTRRGELPALCRLAVLLSCRHVVGQALPASPRRRDRDLHPFTCQRLSYRLGRKTWPTLCKRQRWNYVKNAHRVKGTTRLQAYRLPDKVKAQPLRNHFPVEG